MFWVRNEDWMSLMGAVTTMQLMFLVGGSSVARQKKMLLANGNQQLQLKMPK